MANRLPRLNLPAGRPARLAGLIALALAAVAAYLWLAPTTERKTTANDKTASELASWVGGALSSELAQIRSAVVREPLAAVIADAEARTRAEARLGQSHPDVLRARLLAHGHERTDYEAKPPLTYASLSLLRRSETEGRPPPIEAQMVGSDQAQIVFLVRVEDTDHALRGHVLFSLNPAMVQRTLDAVPWPGGFAEVLQPVEGASPVVLARAGNPAETRPVMRDIPGTGWRIAYRSAAPRPARDEAGPGTVLLWSGATALLLAAAALTLWELRRRRPHPEPVPAAGEATLAARAEAASPTPTPPYEPPAAPPPLPTVEEVSAIEAEAAGTPASSRSAGLPPAHIFLAYDIRGVVGESLDAEGARAIGRAIGSEAYDRGQQAIVVGRDGRRSSPELAQALVAGLIESGRDVIDIGQVATPVLYFAAEYLDTHSAVMVTGSHNPPQYNGFKVLLGGEWLAEAAIAGLRTRLLKGDLVTGPGSVQSLEMDAEYIRRVTDDIPAALGNASRLVIDAGNGVAGEIAPRLFRALGHDVTELYCEVDGDFPGHLPDPSQPDNLADLILTVQAQQADLGFAFDGDGDRLVVVDGAGNIVWPDRLLMLFAFDVLARNPGATVLYDVKCSSRVPRVVAKLGGKPEICRSGHSLVKARLKETGALLAGEASGHIYIRDRWYGFDDALYAGARLLEFLRARGGSPSDVFAKLPSTVSTPELRVPMSPEQASSVVARLSPQAFPGATVTDIDGLRAEFPDGWGLVRASHTMPELVLRFEGDTQEALRRVEAVFREALLAVDPRLTLPI